jgi:hypothetical protein
MKSLTSRFPTHGFWLGGSKRLGNAKSRLVRVIGRYQAEARPDPVSLLSDPPKAVEEEAIQPLYGSSAYFSAYIDEELLRHLLDDDDQPDQLAG